MEADVVHTIPSQYRQANVSVIALVPYPTGGKISFVRVNGKGNVEVKKQKIADFRKKYVAAAWGRRPFDPKIIAAELLDYAVSYYPKVVFSNEAIDNIERILKMDTRGKSTSEIREEIIKAASNLPKSHHLRAIPSSFKTRGDAITRYTEVRQAILKAETPTKKESEHMAKKKAAAKKDNKKTAAKKDNKKTAAKAPAKAKGKTRQDLTGSYIAAGPAAKVKSTDELGMHEDSVRTKVLAVVLGSKAKNGVELSALEKAGGDKTRGAVQYLVKKGFLTKA